MWYEIWKNIYRQRRNKLLNIRVLNVEFLQLLKTKPSYPTTPTRPSPVDPDEGHPRYHSPYLTILQTLPAPVIHMAHEIEQFADFLSLHSSKSPVAAKQQKLGWTRTVSSRAVSLSFSRSEKLGCYRHNGQLRCCHVNQQLLDDGERCRGRQDGCGSKQVTEGWTGRWSKSDQSIVLRDELTAARSETRSEQWLRISVFRLCAFAW